jgi:hypothetical protein
MPQILGPPANSIARVTLLSLLIVPLLAIGLGYAVMQYIADASITHDQPVPFSQEHHMTGSDWIVVIDILRSNGPLSLVCRPTKPA